MRMIPLTFLLVLSNAFAAQVTLAVTGLPAGATGRVMVGKASVKLGGAAQLANGTYTLQGLPVAVGGKVFVARPSSLTVKGNTKATVNYFKLPPGNLDPTFAEGGTRKINIVGLPVMDRWTTVTTSGDLPVLSSAGSSTNNRAALVGMTGAALGPVTTVTSPSRQRGNGCIPSPMISDGDGFLAGLSEVTGTVVRYTAQGQIDEAWKTTPAAGPLVRGLLRWQGGNILAYGGQSAPELWLLDGRGTAVASFGEGGRLGLAQVDTTLGGYGHVRAARLMPDGRVRLAVVEGQALALMDVDTAGQATLVAPAVKAPFALTSLDHVDNVSLRPDGSVLALTAGGTGDQSQLIRVTSKGQLDQAFRSPPVSSVLAMAGVAVQADGKVVVARRMNDQGGGSLLTRYLPSGAVDPSFGEKGHVRLKDLVYGLEITSDGKLMVISAALGKALEESSAFLRFARLLTE